MRRIKRWLSVLPAVALAAACFSIGSASAATQRFAGTKSEWQVAMAKVAKPSTGCYHAAYPVLQWHAVKCMTAPKWPLAPRLPSGPVTHAAPATVGDGTDYSAVTTGLISQATGTFQDVSSGITEAGQVDATGPQVTNAFSLQLNTQFFTGSPACSGASDPSSCLAWQQFVYAFDGCGPSCIFMQYWLIDYNATCPAGWFAYSTDCYTNSSATGVTDVSAADLASLKFSGSAKSGGNDAVSMSVGTGTAATVSNTDSEVDLAAWWNTTEWDVFGDAGGGEANFGTGTTLEPTTTLTATNSSAPSCVVEGFTAETNNLTLTSTPALGSEKSPTMASLQTNGTTGTASCATAAGAPAASTTTLKLSTSAVTYGHENSEHLSVRVKSAHPGGVTGKVTITAKAPKHSSVKVCVITLKSGAGSCTLKAKALKAATWTLKAAYGGASGILKSTSSAKTLKVRK